MSNNTNRILSYFEKLGSIPRGSKNEKKAALWLIDWGKSKGFKTDMDNQGNVLITVPSTSNNSPDSPIVLQAHIDMVCEKNEKTNHDFTKDGIKMLHNGDWISADGTTLGADDGIGIAIAMAIAEDSTITHSGLELLFTVDEEAGMSGALGLQPGFLTGKYLINVDSEDEGVVTIGSAGGKRSTLSLRLNPTEPPLNRIEHEISIEGLSGGHSGMDINKGRANAAVLLARTISSLPCVFNLGSFLSGNAANVIPSKAEALLTTDPAMEQTVMNRVKEMERIFRIEHSGSDENITIKHKVNSFQTLGKYADASDSKKAIHFITAIPDGVFQNSKNIEGLVETSNNIGMVKFKDGSLEITSLQRSSSDSRLDEITGKIGSIAFIAGADFNSDEGYPAWQPNVNSVLLKTARNCHKKLFCKDLKTEIIHAGLECGIIFDKFPGIDIISLGPTMKDVHTPNERLFVPSVDNLYRLISEIICSLNH